MIAITHTHADGTVVSGDPRPHQQVLKDAGFRWSRSVGWYIRGSRDRDAQQWRIDKAATGLRTAGFDVTVDVDNTARDVGEREADRAERLEGRQDALEANAQRKLAEAEHHLGRAQSIMDMVPFGQPILAGHHSERRHRKDLERIEQGLRRGFDTQREAQETARRAEASRRTQEHRESGPATLRRIAKFEAELRRIDRELTPCRFIGRRMKPAARGVEVRCPGCYLHITIGDDLLVPVHGGPTPSQEAHWLTQKARVEGELAHWRTHIAELEADGFRQYGPDDFTAGDPVFASKGSRLLGTVAKVNRKTLAVDTGHMPWPIKFDYSEVRPASALDAVG